jgi:hypothetical protein
MEDFLTRKGDTAMEVAMVVGPGLTPDWKWVDRRDGIFSALQKQTIQGLRFPGTGFTLDQLQLVTEHRNPFALEMLPEEMAEIVALEREKWERIFRKGSMDFSDLVVFPRRTGHDWPILVPKKMANNKLFAACQEKFQCWKYTDNLDIIGPAQSFTTLRWFKKIQEADEDLQNLSADMLLERGTPCVWFQERLWMGLNWFMENRDHLDVQNATLIAGSRGPGGDVPLMNFDGVKINVGNGTPGAHRPDWRARSAG